MKYLEIEEKELLELNGIHTAKEIQQQPDVWLKIYSKIKYDAKGISDFINKAVSDVDEIILTGAGTSAYIGQCLQGEYKKSTHISTQAVATTEIVTHPQNYFFNNKKVLLISFARSGNSPESCASLDLAEKFAEKAYHLVITCNKNGALLTSNRKPLQYNIVLPEETNDLSLAMTSSFSGMLLSGLLASRISNIKNEQKNVETIAKYGRNIIANQLPIIKKIAKLNFNRAVFLGSGALFGTATESHLKLQELSDGQVICKNESFLAFRHGPKAVINNKTIVVFLLSNNKHAHKYEVDLVKAIKKENQAMSLIGISETTQDINLNTEIVLSKTDTHKIDEEFLTVCNVLPSQILGFFKSLDLGLKPDTPSVSGTIARVVEGVVIYK